MGDTETDGNLTPGQARDVMVTGMGFCLPGTEEPTRTASELWEIASQGQSCLSFDDIFYGKVNLPDPVFGEYVKDIPGTFSEHYTATHKLGLVSLIEACADAKLDIRDGGLSKAAILVGRGGADANIECYLDVLRSAEAADNLRDAMGLFIGAKLGTTPSDVALVQAAVARSTGQCFTVSCGCASSAVQLGNARSLIASGQADIAVVTGADSFGLELIRKMQQALRVVRRSDTRNPPAGVPDLLLSLDHLMRPYDRHAGSVNYGEGSVTLILESRDHASRRGAHCYGQVLSHAMARDGLANPLAPDEEGSGLVRAIQSCLEDRWGIRDIPYINGGSDGNAVVTVFEANAIRQLRGDGSDLMMTSQEGCFGHTGAAAGTLGVALSLLMMERHLICPTTNCEEPADDLPFDPLPGGRARSLDFRYAMSLNYQVGGVKSAILVGSADSGE